MAEPRFPFKFFDSVRRMWVPGGNKASKAELEKNFELYTITGDGELSSDDGPYPGWVDRKDSRAG